jgi:hypothetical protein
MNMLSLHKLLCDAWSSLKCFCLLNSSNVQVFHDMMSLNVIEKIYIDRSVIHICYAAMGKGSYENVNMTDIFIVIRSCPQ